MRVYADPIWTRTPEARAKRRTTVQALSAAGTWRKTHPGRPTVLRIRWNCERCGVEKETLPSHQRRYCGHLCSRQASKGRVINNARFRYGQELRARHAEEVVRLYQTGLGSKRISTTLGISKGMATKILRERGLYQPGKLKPLLGGPCSRFAHLRPRSYKRTLFSMRVRVRRCLDKPPPKPVSPVAGMSDAEAFKWRYHNDPKFRLYQLLRRRLKKVIREGVKRGRSLELVGCTTAHLRAHIEALFKRGMNWQNSGTGRGKWHLDHHIPCAVFDLTREDQQRICFHWTNLRPMWSLANIRKGKRMPKALTPCLL